MIARDALHRHRMRLRPDMAVSVIEVFGRVMIDRMAARLRGQHQRKARIARDVDLVERVHLDSDAKRHWGLLLCVGHVGARRREVTRSRRSRYRSEEHTSELQSLMRISYAVFCLNKKK